MDKVFLGGTWANTTWRDELIPLLTIDYFNPVVEDWTSECQAIEEQEKASSKLHLYVITSKMQGVYSIAEVIDSTHMEGKYTICQVVPDGFTYHQMKSLYAVGDMVLRNGGTFIVSEGLEEIAATLNYLGGKQRG
jgi:hypothetical protein